MTGVRRLVTTAELMGMPEPGTISVSVLLEAELDDGRRIVLLDDRGWTAAQRGPGAPTPWSVGDIETTARQVTGPDEPPAGMTQQDAFVSHWATLSATLEARGVAVEREQLSRLPNDVVMGERLQEVVHPQP